MQDDLVFFRPIDPTPDDRLLELYIAGECTPAEQYRFEQWLANNPKLANSIRAMRAASRAEAMRAQLPEDIDIEAAEARIVERVSENTNPSGNSPSDGEQNRLDMQGKPLGHASLAQLRRWAELRAAPYGVNPPANHSVNRSPSLPHNRSTKIAGLAAASIVLAIAVVFNFNSSTFQAFNPWRIEPSISIAGSALTTYTTGNADRATVKLPDGSTVTLNSASRLYVPADYVSGNRTLLLEGEALFQVVGRPRIPFVVMAGGTRTRVLGTRFIVRHYATDRATVVAVQEGKVAVRDQVLTARQKLEVLPSGETNLSTITQINETFADGILVFNGVPLTEAIEEINRWYDVDVRLGDASLEARELRWKVSHSSMTDLMEILEVTLNVRIVREGRVLTLYPRQ